MLNTQYRRGKVKLAYSKKQIQKAGDCIRKNEGDIEQAIEVVRNFRAAHLYPLTIIKNLVWLHTKKVAPTSIIARRLKRLPTIIDKLRRSTLNGNKANALNLKRMQDIGGCRVILLGKEQLIQLNESLDNSKTIHTTIRVKDYTVEKKSTGYRGIHRIYKCYDQKEDHPWKNFHIEVQLRTKLQHIWATTVEIVDLCENKTLKTNPFDADKDWIEYFTIMSDFLAEEDGFIHLNNETKNKMTRRIKSLNVKLNAYNKLASFRAVFSRSDVLKKSEGKSLAVLAIDNENRKVAYYFYDKGKKNEALKMYNKVEDEDQKNALFVEMDDIKNLKSAYPNYLLDTSAFLNKYQAYITNTYWQKP